MSGTKWSQLSVFIYLWTDHKIKQIYKTTIKKEEMNLRGCDAQKMYGKTQKGRGGGNYINPVLIYEIIKNVLIICQK